MSTREQLMDLSMECEELCVSTEFVGPETGQANFRLIYTSPETYEESNRFAIIGENPGGDLSDADTDDPNRPFWEKGYSAYLDDDWRGRGRGQSPFQRAVQGAAMVATGASPTKAIAVMRQQGFKPESRIGTEATTFLRHTPSLNIIPFRHSNMDQLNGILRERGAQIGWELLCLIRPRPRYIITLANQVSGPIWGTILSKSGQPKGADYEEWINRNARRKYREVTLTQGPLKGAVLLGLPAVVYDKVRDDVTPQLLKTLSRRLRHHDHLQN